VYNRCDFVCCVALCDITQTVTVLVMLLVHSPCFHECQLVDGWCSSQSNLLFNLRAASLAQRHVGQEEMELDSMHCMWKCNKYNNQAIKLGL
jgi:hypothetical protein